MHLTQLLDSLPFNRYEKEAIAYLATIDAATARKLYQHTKIPQGRIYGILQELQRKGLVAVIPTTPQQYQIKDIKQALILFLQREEAKLEEKEKVVASLEVAPKLFTHVKAPSIAFFTGRDEHLQAIITLRQTAVKELLQIAPLFIGSFAGNRSLQKALEKKVSCKIIIKEVNGHNKKAVNDGLQAGAQIRVLNSPDLLSMILKDSNELLLGVQNYHHEEERVTLYTQNKGLIDALHDTFSRLWKQAKPVKDS